ncbi:MAG TPA: DUF262 domain-containing protein [Rhizomicrobium sp.]
MIRIRRPYQIGTDQHHVTEIVDGQQRLTTLIKLLKSIERELDRDKPFERQIGDELATLPVKPDSASLPRAMRRRISGPGQAIGTSQTGQSRVSP